MIVQRLKMSENQHKIYFGSKVKYNHLIEAQRKYFDDGEKTIGVFTGKRGMGQTGGMKGHYLILTDKRVLMWQRGLTSDGIETFLYSNISNVEGKQSITDSSITLNVHGARETMGRVPRNDVPVIVKMIQEQMEKKRTEQEQIGHSKPHAAPEDPTNILKRRLASGEISKDEYNELMTVLTGDKVGDNSEPGKVCEGCGTKNEKSSAFCTKCGTSL